MARKQRPLVAGYPIHIIQRGNDRKACFFADEDYQFFRDHLADLARRFKCALHAYVLMTNHTHLLLTPEIPEGPSLLMKFLGQRYVQYVNKTYKRTGTLWEGRFRSGVVQSEHYLLACYRLRQRSRSRTVTPDPRLSARRQGAWQHSLPRRVRRPEGAASSSGPLASCVSMAVPLHHEH